MTWIKGDSTARRDGGASWSEAGPSPRRDSGVGFEEDNPESRRDSAPGTLLSLDPFEWVLMLDGSDPYLTKGNGWRTRTLESNRDG
jgi:hypothetical protein